MSHLHDVLAQPAFALIRVRDSDTVTLLGGDTHRHRTAGRHPVVDHG